jgi:preprotein translocase subunit SecG
MLLGILLAAVIVVCIALVGVILLQRSEGGVLGMSGGGTGNFMSARGTGDLLTRTTQILAAVFFGLCLIMTLVTGHIRRQSSLENQLKGLAIAPGAASSQPPASAAPPSLNRAAPAAPTAPAAPLGNGLNLFGNTAAPAAPARVQPAPAPIAAAPAPQAAAPKPPVAGPKAAAVPSAKPAARPKAASSEKPAASSAAPAPIVTPAPLAVPPPPAAPPPAPAAAGASPAGQ